MTLITNNLDGQQKELCAVAVMRSMLEDYSTEKGIAFEDAFLSLPFLLPMKCYLTFQPGYGWKDRIISEVFLKK